MLQVCKWWKIADSMNASGHSLLPRNIATYKRQMGRNLWRLQLHFLLHDLNRKQHKVLGFDLVKKYKPECVLPLQQKNV
jgi:hypothetical protein